MYNNSAYTWALDHCWACKMLTWNISHNYYFVQQAVFNLTRTFNIEGYKYQINDYGNVVIIFRKY